MERSLIVDRSAESLWPWRSRSGEHIGYECKTVPVDRRMYRRGTWPRQSGTGAFPTPGSHPDRKLPGTGARRRACSGRCWESRYRFEWNRQVRVGGRGRDAVIAGIQLQLPQRPRRGGLDFFVDGVELHESDFVIDPSIVRRCAGQFNRFVLGVVMYRFLDVFDSVIFLARQRDEQRSGFVTGKQVVGIREFLGEFVVKRAGKLGIGYPSVCLCIRSVLVDPQRESGLSTYGRPSGLSDRFRRYSRTSMC